MTKHELLSFIKSSEKELDCVTPGAYCHRRVAFRAMELLQLQASKEASVAVAEVITTANEKITATQSEMSKLLDELRVAKATINRQAQALTELQKPKSSLGSGMAKQSNQYIEDENGFMRLKNQREQERSYLEQRERERYSKYFSASDLWFKDARQL